MEQEMLIPLEPLSSPPVLVGFVLCFVRYKKRSESVIRRMTNNDLQNIAQNPLKLVVNSGVPEVLASPAPYVT
jgi:hypothetical protein